MPLISVIVPVYNEERYLAEALQSIENQTYSRIEIIVVDDGSSDGTASVIRKFPSAIPVFQSHSGLSAALNNGIKNANGNFLAFLDADDIWLEDKLSNQMKIFENNSGIEAVFGHIIQFEENADQGKAPDSSRKIPGYCKGSMLIKKASFLRVGFFDIRWRIGDFIDWYKRAVDKNLRISLISDIVMKRRVHSGNMSLTGDGEKRDYVRILKAALDRSRVNKNKEES